MKWHRIKLQLSEYLSIEQNYTRIDYSFIWRRYVWRIDFSLSNVSCSFLKQGWIVPWRCQKVEVNWNLDFHGLIFNFRINNHRNRTDFNRVMIPTTGLITLSNQNGKYSVSSLKIVDLKFVSTFWLIILVLVGASGTHTRNEFGRRDRPVTVTTEVYKRSSSNCGLAFWWCDFRTLLEILRRGF